VSLVLLIGGASAGKSTLAVELASRSQAAVTFIATAEAHDQEMQARIDRHRAARPARWKTIEEPLEVRSALEGIAESDFVILDCLTLWVANLIGRGDPDDEVLAEAAAVADLAARRETEVVVITNEVGLGIVPATPLGRAYRDLLGAVNGVFADRAERAVFVVAGRALPLTRAGDLLG
jgi:adenosylcobinamide kinase / adenosylcobinamide-phosphate guanylyltransferase